MRKVFAVALTMAMVGAVGFSQSAKAGVTYDYVFSSTDINGNPIAGGSVTGGGMTFSFTSTAAANAATGVVLNVILTTTEPLFAAAVSVQWDDSNGLASASVTEWVGQGVVFNMMNQVTTRFAPLGFTPCGANICPNFDGNIPPPSGPPSLPAGTYNMGTIVWDTSALTASSAVMTIVTGLDGTGSVPNGDITGTEVTNMGFINIIPEPATAGLLGLGLVGLVMAGRRRNA